MYDVTDFLPSHPGGSKIVRAGFITIRVRVDLYKYWGLASQNATEEYDPVQPPGTLEEHLKPETRSQEPEARLGAIEPDTLPKEEATKDEKHLDDGPPPLESLLNLDELEAAGSKRISRKAWAYYGSGGDDLISKHLNNKAYRSILLRPRIFVDCEHCDSSTTIVGCKVGLPV